MEAKDDSKQRITLRLLAYWEKLRLGRDMPSPSDINADDLQDLWDYCFIINLKDFDKDLKAKNCDYTYLGKALQTSCLNASNPEASEESPLNFKKLSKNCLKAIQNSSPLLDEGEFVTPQNNIVKYRECLLPLGENGRIEAILGGMRFRLY